MDQMKIETVFGKALVNMLISRLLKKNGINAVPKINGINLESTTLNDGRPGYTVHVDADFAISSMELMKLVKGRM